ncbi:helix-turn-helix transcriptional regulator [Nonomuraea roseoviolacea subsp. roseoviolacea]|uniref:helix-turn-helix domain-containing protein n=1 Tax=Nonomuraea roseoviolacea TaxID=103837 RepID=UPI0031CE304D
MTTGSEQPGETSPTLRRRLLAAELRRLRGKRSREEAAKAIGLTGTAITRFETVYTAPTELQVRGLLDVYEATPEEHDRLIGLCRDSQLLDWWQPHREAIPSQYEFFFGLETEAAKIRSYELGFIPGLLQTADYYRSYLLTPPVAFPEDDIEKLVQFRLARQKRRLTGPNLHVILDEAVLHRHVGGSHVMRDQLEHIHRTVSSHQNITLQILPFSAGSHQALDGSFLIMEFAEQTFQDVVYLESQVEGRYLEAIDTVNRYNLVFDHLTYQALSAEESLKLLGRTERSIR